MNISFNDFMAIVRWERAENVFEKWDEDTFNEYIAKHPMTAEDAFSFCRMAKLVAEDEEANGVYFAKR